MYGYGHEMYGWGYPLALTGMVLLWAAVIYGIVALVRYVGGSSRQAGERGPAPAAEQLLAERFARGEIDEDEYLRRRATLQAG